MQRPTIRSSLIRDVSASGRGGLFSVWARSKFGRSVASSGAGTVSPVNFGWLYPSPEENDGTFLEQYVLIQSFTDWLMVVAGRGFWVTWSDRNRFANSERMQFMNAALRNNHLLNRLTALSSHGVVPVFRPHEDLNIVVATIAANDVDGVYGSPGGLFSEVTTAIEMDYSWNVAGLPGTMRPGFGWTSRDPSDLTGSRLTRDVFHELAVPTRDDNWVVYVNLE